MGFVFFSILVITSWLAITVAVCSFDNIDFLSGKLIPPDTVDSLNITAYSGRWFQMYASLLPNSTYEKGAYCITADYNTPPIPFGKVALTITYSENLDSPTGTLDQVEGVLVSTSDPGKFTTIIDKGKGKIAGPYWVIALGDIPEGGSEYPWAAVSTPLMTALYIIARDVNDFRQNYESDVLALVAAKGYTCPFTKPRPTYQEDDCEYAPTL